MKLKFYSDLHVDINQIKSPEEIFSSNEKVDLYLDAGDTGELDNLETFYQHKFWKDKKVAFVSGNHLCYSRQQVPIDLADEELKKMFYPTNNIVYLQNEEYPITNGLSVLGATLWTDFKLFGKKNEFKCKYLASKKLNDYNFVKYTNDSFLTPELTTTMFNITVKFLKRKLSSDRKKKFIILTHHAPSLQSCSLKYRDDFISGAFASNMKRFIETNPNILLWIHGHVHNKASYIIGNTAVACNPLGYITYGESYDFDKNLVLDI